MAPKTRITYVTSSDYKKRENEAFLRLATLGDGSPVVDYFEFDIRNNIVTEILEVSIEAMVTHEAIEAYSMIKTPCVVEHAGLVFNDYASQSYPGGLTKPMWNTLGDRFIEETKSAGRKAVARAVVGYCDGHSVITFVGETPGMIADNPRGSHKFYWDTVFIPDTSAPLPRPSMTYAEIVDEVSLGLDYKVANLSQSSKAMLKFLEHRRANAPDLWRSVGTPQGWRI